MATVSAQLRRWSGTQWDNINVQTTVAQVSDLTSLGSIPGVTITSPATGASLVWDGSNWVDGQPKETEDQNTNHSTGLKFWSGTLTEYNTQTSNGSTADSTTIYFIDE